MSLKVTSSGNNKSWRQLLVEESDLSLRARGGKRETTFRRMYMTVIVLFGAAFLFYCSLFYIGAFVDIGKIVGISQKSRADTARTEMLSKPPEAKRGVLAPFQDAFRVNRVYLRRGQAIQTSFSIPLGTELNLSVKQCKSKPVLEIFTCEFIHEQKAIITDKTNGTVEFRVDAPGFYYFGDQGTRLPSTILKSYYEYQIIWRRG